MSGNSNPLSSPYNGGEKGEKRCTNFLFFLIKKEKIGGNQKWKGVLSRACDGVTTEKNVAYSVLYARIKKEVHMFLSGYICKRVFITLVCFIDKFAYLFIDL